MIMSFSEFLNEDSQGSPTSPFKEFDVFKLKRDTKEGKKGDLNRAGRMADWIYRNQGLSSREIYAAILGYPSNTSQTYMYHRGGQAIDNILQSLVPIPYIIRSDERPARWYARLDDKTTIDEIKHKHRGQITGRTFGI